MRFLNKYGRYESLEPESWSGALRVSESGTLGSVGVSIVTLSSIVSLVFLFFCGVGGVGGDLLFLNGYEELDSVEPESWAAASGVSSPGASGEGVVSIVYLSSMFFTFPFENSSVSSFRPDGSKCVSGEMAEEAAAAAAVAAGAAEVKIAASRLD